ncbi:peptide transporter PTR2-A [Lojkania enalia]|uniref:Peptide transporter PTR2-A n=1 Tax=Lojkania enalia TaxID=147567 RepID=A0A9P4MXL9_9PLEO|nr:peptide transporter PTR2-A [Didymosphaeria enalia]
MDPSLVDGSGDPDRKHPDAHKTSLPTYMAEGKTMQDEYLDSTALPTEEELHTLRRVGGHIPWKVFSIAFIELVERMSYYGTIAVFSNFISKPNPGTATGAAVNPDDEEAVPGALNLGKQVAFSLTTFNAFWVYCMPLVGAWLADTYWGRYKTIVISVIIAEVGHIILTASAAPSVIKDSDSSLAAFVIGLVIMGVGTGWFKPNISPLIAEQIPEQTMHVTTTKSGERVIMDPAITITRLYNWFYFFINVGALVGQIAMVYAERYVGFYLSYLLPTLMFLVCLPILFFCRKQYVVHPPAGSVLPPAMKLLWLNIKSGWHLNPITSWKTWQNGSFWENNKPSRLGDAKPKWMTFDDAWVDEVARGFNACVVFIWIPVFWLAYRQMDSNLTAMCATMALHGIPNDILSNLDPLAIIILVPIMDILVYPALRKRGIRFTPIKKITAGFMVATASMIWATVTQHYVYKTSGYYDTKDPDYKSPINVWVVAGIYVLIAVSEIFASVTTLEYAFTKAPKNMRSLVQSVSLFTSAFSAALAQAWTPLAADPHLVWNYASVAIISFVFGILFYWFNRNLDKDEDKLNQLPTGHLTTQSQAEDLERRLSVSIDPEKTTTLTEKEA